MTEKTPKSPSGHGENVTLDSKSAPLQPASAYGEKAFILFVIVLAVAVFVGLGFIVKYGFDELGGSDGVSEEVAKSKPLFESSASGDNLDLYDIQKSVVNVICPHADAPFNLETDQNQGGSGYVMNEEGRILINYHVLTTDEDPGEVMPLHEEGCFVLFPEEETGFSYDTYVARPVFYPRLSYNFDFAFLDIYDVYSDDEETYGEYPRTFPPLNLELCSNDELDLGDRVIGLGYPGVTDGYSLTLSEGIISAFTSYDSFYSTSNLGGGGSGGIVVSEDGCLAGIYSGVVYDEYIFYGEVYTAESIDDFVNQSKNIEQKREKDEPEA